MKYSNLYQWEKLVLDIALITFVIFFIKFSYYFFTPVSYWFNYVSIEPLQEEFSTEVYFVSTRQINREANYEWEDILYCDIKNLGEKIYFSIYSSSKRSKATILEEKTWRYGSSIPENGRCYLRSHIVAALPYGIEKDQVLMSSEFDIKN